MKCPVCNDRGTVITQDSGSYTEKPCHWCHQVQEISIGLIVEHDLPLAE